MTGLPPPVPVPPRCPPPDPVAHAARAWLTASSASAGAGDATVAALRRAAAAGRAGWSGPAALAASRHAERVRREATAVSDAGLVAVACLAGFAQALRHLATARSELVGRLDEEAGTLRSLALEPDLRPDAPALRSAAWERHRVLAADVATWQARARSAEDCLVATLASPPRATSHHELLDRAHRALLPLDPSAAAEATRRALREGGTATRLLTLDAAAFDGDGSVVVAYGDLATADHVAVVVPGMTTDARSIGEVGAMARAVSAAAGARSSGTTATIAWVGYDAPADRDLARGRLRVGDLSDIARVTGARAAERGARELVRFVEGLGAGRDVTVVGHSYGATTAAHAAAAGMAADRLVLLGSPGAGAGAPTADALRLPTWVAAHDLDPVTWIGGLPGPLGVDPAHREFGAQRLPTDPVDAPHLDRTGDFVAIHAGYLSPGSASLDAVAAVVVGQRPPTVPARAASGTALAADWLAGQAAYELTSWR